MAYGLVQSNIGYAYTTSLGIAFESNVTTGNLIIVATSAYGNQYNLACTDSQGNTYTPLGIVENYTDDNWIHAWYAFAGSTGANTVTITTVNTNYRSVGILEYSGIASVSPLDGEDKDSGTSTLASSDVATTNATDLIFGWGSTKNYPNYPIDTEGDGFALREKFDGNVPEFHLLVEDKRVTSTGTHAATMGVSPSTEWGIGVAAFKETTSPPAEVDLQITDATGAQLADAPSITQLQAARPNGDITIGNWTRQDSATTDLFDAINEATADDADYVTTPLAEAASILEVSLTDVVDPEVHTSHSVSFRVGGSGGLTVRLMQGTTEIASWTYTISSLETKFEELTELQAAAITDYGDLRLRFEAVS